MPLGQKGNISLIKVRPDLTRRACKDQGAPDENGRYLKSGGEP